MKLQIQQQTLRFRIDEAELAGLLDGGTIENATRLGADTIFRQSIALADAGRALFDCQPSHWRLQLPRAQVIEHARRLPCREGLVFAWPDAAGDGAQAGMLQLVFEVDVRDSTRKRIRGTAT
ncbi:hypothetical protein [Pseudoxanthomonas mexicana]|uniref:hypothetical protein n=1 Tax=Pseudoxanthomonas mexicana TaxID=128785 RepID=UPI00398B5915